MNTNASPSIEIQVVDEQGAAGVANSLKYQIEITIEVNNPIIVKIVKIEDRTNNVFVFLFIKITQ